MAHAKYLPRNLRSGPVFRRPRDVVPAVAGLAPDGTTGRFTDWPPGRFVREDGPEAVFALWASRGLARVDGPEIVVGTTGVPGGGS